MKLIKGLLYTVPAVCLIIQASHALTAPTSKFVKSNLINDKVKENPVLKPIQFTPFINQGVAIVPDTNTVDFQDRSNKAFSTTFDKTGKSYKVLWINGKTYNNKLSEIHWISTNPIRFETIVYDPVSSEKNTLAIVTHVRCEQITSNVCHYVSNYYKNGYYHGAGVGYMVFYNPNIFKAIQKKYG